MNLLKNDESLKGRLLYWNNGRLYGECDLYSQVAGESMAPAYETGGYLFCDVTTVEALEPGKAYIFSVKTHPHYTNVFKRFDGIIDGVIHVSAINPAYNPYDPIRLGDLIEVSVPKWRFVEES
ncbi:S24 family peptidase [Fibrella forsythiae]|uniref:S24 family peptidase n=1 Tax=Fibrella forsythiae TaxID=2817061 RepID=A0ABS3JB71_9BACT|nr:S24 family peptidase [Fibrella forsythiae]MBO0947243.1 S24 family peptidase [Fibrella forsythiae]